MDNSTKYISIGGIGSVTKNMSVYENGDEILVVDCGLGFVDETMLGVDLLLPDISYLLKSGKKIVGMVLTHGHEDHIGALPYVLPQLPSFPIYATPLTAALSNEKMAEYGIGARVKAINFDGGEVAIGRFKVQFIRVTHSVPDTSCVFIKTPGGNFLHGSDFKFDLTPFDGKRNEFSKIVKAAEEGITCLLSDSLGAEKEGFTPSETELAKHIEYEMQNTEGKFIMTTFSSNISRLNQAVQAAEKMGRKVCFIGRSLIKAVEIAKELGYMKYDNKMEIRVNQIKNFKDRELCLLVAGSQAQENSALTRISNDEFKEVRISPKDVIVFSSDPIPGNEISINSLIDTISRKGARVLYSELSNHFHVSGHGSSLDLSLMLALARPIYALPIGGTYKHMVAYRNLARKQGLSDQNILLVENGQELIFSGGKVRYGMKHQIRNIFVDEISGGEIESFVLRDREKIAKEGIVIIMAEIDSITGQLIEPPTIIARGLSSQENQQIIKTLPKELKDSLSARAKKNTDWLFIRRLVGELSEKNIYRNLRKRPLVLPVIVEV